MDWYRFKHTIGLYMCLTSKKRALYLKRHNILHNIGEHCSVMFRHIPLYPKLISLGDNVRIASNVNFITHDGIHWMLNNYIADADFQENIGCIDIKDNVFIGSNVTILMNITIGPNTIIGTGSLVNKDIPGGGVYAGRPARYICSLEEYIEKRRNSQPINITRGKGGLAEETVTACWKRFKEK